MASTGALDAVIDATKTKYVEEQSRFQTIEQRASVSLTFTGVLLGLFFVYAGERNYGEAAFGHVVYAIVMLTVIFLLIGFAIYFFMKAIISRPYRQIITTPFLKDDYMENNTESHIKKSIIASYNNAIIENKESINQKSISCNRGLYLLGAAFLVFVVYLILEEVIRYGG
ncbi:MAG: hypothetical protein EA344_12935 [Alkalicoccus sp.]|nr:MAG: hypothetical protein EA344_12935 [Alkalicoccus sp.]